VAVVGFLFWRHKKAKEKTTINIEAREHMIEQPVNNSVSLTFDTMMNRNFGSEIYSMKDIDSENSASSEVALRVKF